MQLNITFNVFSKQVLKNCKKYTQKYRDCENYQVSTWQFLKKLNNKSQLIEVQYDSKSTQSFVCDYLLHSALTCKFKTLHQNVNQLTIEFDNSRDCELLVDDEDGYDERKDLMYLSTERRGLCCIMRNTRIRS